MHLMYPGRDFAWLYERVSGRPCARPFEHFGGVVVRCIYDNLKATVKRRIGIERN